jgi:diguanylate cyclase (GGDEF)-like protein/PAS domain S-box-containing protein
METTADSDDKRGAGGAESALRLSEEKFRKAFGLTPDAMNINRLADGLFVTINRGFTQITGYEESDVIGKTSFDLNIWVDPNDRTRLAEGLRQQGSVINLEAQFRTKSGDVGYGLMSAAIIQLDNVPHILSITRDITERKNLEIRQKQSEDKFRRLAEDLPAFYVTFLPDGTLMFVNDAVAKVVCISREKLAGMNFLEFLTPADRTMVQSKLAALTPDQPVETHEQIYQRPGHTQAYHQWTNRAFFDSNGRVQYFQAIGQDITQRKRDQEELRIAATAFESQVGMTITDSNSIILKVNKAFSEITGFCAEEAVGQTPRMLSSGRHGASFYAAMWQSLSLNGKWAGEIWNRRKSGEVYPEWLTVTAVKDNSGQNTHYVGTFLDISDRKLADDRIKELAFYDPLTRLPNRRLLMDRLDVALASCNRHLRRGALLFVDLDNFKLINDTLGHHRGDRLLELVALRLSAWVRDGDTVARLGGDEFVVMLEDLSEHEIDAAMQAEAVSAKIHSALNQAYQIEGVDHHSTPSIGITLFGGGQSEAIEEPLKRADLAMYQAKAAGRNTMRFFEPRMQEEISSRAELEDGLRDALERNEFLLYYQPQISGPKKITGAEALVRWNHPVRGIVPPGDFIALAEESDLILALGEWVLNTACMQLAQWADRPQLAHLTVAVNVSARQFRHTDFADQVLEVLDRAGANPKRLKLELTEGLLIKDIEGVIAKMGKLKALGVGFSLDDFGTGYSSLAYLKRLPLDQLKIDQGFVRDILIDPNDAAISKMVIVLAESLGLEVIAEGVETEAQMNLLASQGCNAYQGYLYSKPLPLDEFEAFVTRI